MTPYVQKTQAIYTLYPNVFCIKGEKAFDAEGSEVAYDLEAVNSKVVEMQAEEDAKKQAAQAKLAKLGLTTDDLKALLG